MQPSSSNMPVLALTMGEPAGIGPELALKVWLERDRFDIPPFVLIASKSQMTRCVSEMGYAVGLQEIFDPADAAKIFNTALPLIDITNQTNVAAGRPDQAAAKGVIEAIETAARLALAGKISAIVTNPINKKNLYDSGFAFPGHTEFLAHLAHNGASGPAPLPVMMLEGGGLRAIPVTIHIPLGQVVEALTTDLIIATGQIVHDDMVKRFGLARPRIVVAGLNPHAGEDGALGTEDRDIITPAIDALKARGIDIRGPLSADTLFHEKARQTYDVALCMYHDQALIPVKTLGFESGVNITLGLTFIRTSPDHGTAYDIAGTGTADPQSLIAALKVAAKMSEHSARYTLENGN